MTATDAQQELQRAMQDRACEWIVRLRSDTVSEADYQEFALWLAANPAHRSAMDTMLEMWGDLGAVRYLPEKSAPRTAPRHSTRRRWLATGVALAASVLIALVLSPRFNPGLNNLDYQTRVGEQLTATLEDGSSIRLNTDSSLQVSFDRQQRHLTLHRGEAFFEVAHDPARPFIVRAGTLEVRALGTAFNIHLQGTTGVVTVTKGVVRVTELDVPPSRPAASELLYHDQQLTGGEGGLGPATPVDVGRDLAWRDGKLVAEEMPLSVLVQELSRYHPTRIFIAEPQIGQRTVSGVFQLEDLDGILLALEHTAQVRGLPLEDGSIQLIGAPL